MTLDVSIEADRQSWDDFVSTHPAANFMQSHAWGEFQRRMGWDVHHCTLGGASQPRAAALLLSRSIPGLGRVFQTPRGPVADYDDPELVAEFMGELESFVRREGGVFLRCDPYWSEPRPPEGRFDVPGAQPIPRDWSDWNGPRFVFWLDLSGDEEEVMMRMTSRARNDVRRGYRNDVAFSEGTPDELDEFYRLMVLTGQLKGIAFRKIEYYRTLLDVVSEGAEARLFFGRHEDTVVTTGMSVKYGERAWLLYAATDPDHYKLRATRTQQWEMIRWAHAHGCSRYDFRGTATGDPPSKDDPGYGVYEFKKSFGPEFTRLIGYYDVVAGARRHRLLRFIEDRGLPVAYKLKTWIQR